MHARNHGGVRIYRDNEENAGFLARWNWMGAVNMPYWTFCHHKVIYLPEEVENLRYNVDDFNDNLVARVQALSASKSSPGVEVLTGDITIFSYASLTSLIYNQSSLGCSKERGGVNY
jgi:hypothetical protein